jgi:lysophospholipase
MNARTPKTGRVDRRALPSAAMISTWEAPDRWTHRRLDWPQPEGAAARGSLLFASGRGDFIEKYVEALAVWHAAGWNVTAFDWRSQGGSRGDIAGGNLASLDLLVDDYAALVAEWGAATPEPHVGIGHSMGGHVLLRAVAEQRVKLDAAVLVAPMLQVNSGPLPSWGAWSVASFLSSVGWGGQPMWQRGAFSDASGSPRQAILTSCPERYADELWWWQQQPGYNLGAPSWGWLEAAYRSSAKLTPERLRKIETPILLLGTERDRLVSREAIRRAVSLIPGAELKMFAEAGHEILRERDDLRLEAFATIDAFLDRHAPAADRKPKRA